jgi:hypothetical protein
LATGVIAALAIAAPVAEASAATPREVPFFGPTAGVAVAIGPTVIGSVFNGGTTVVVSTSPALGSVNFSP